MEHKYDMVMMVDMKKLFLEKKRLTCVCKTL